MAPLVRTASRGSVEVKKGRESPAYLREAPTGAIGGLPPCAAGARWYNQRRLVSLAEVKLRLAAEAVSRKRATNDMFESDDDAKDADEKEVAGYMQTVIKFSGDSKVVQASISLTQKLWNSGGSPWGRVQQTTWAEEVPNSWHGERGAIATVTK